MKEYDKVRVINDRERYKKDGVHKGMVGVIMDPRCINGKWLVICDGHFEQSPDGVWYTTDVECDIQEEDLEIISLEEYIRLAEIQSKNL